MGTNLSTLSKQFWNFLIMFADTLSVFPRDLQMQINYLPAGGAVVVSGFPRNGCNQSNALKRYFIRQYR